MPAPVKVQSPEYATIFKVQNMQYLRCPELYASPLQSPEYEEAFRVQNMPTSSVFRRICLSNKGVRIDLWSRQSPKISQSLLSAAAEETMPKAEMID
jgi:hypothetical protein